LGAFIENKSLWTSSDNWETLAKCLMERKINEGSRNRSRSSFINTEDDFYKIFEPSYTWIIDKGSNTEESNALKLTVIDEINAHLLHFELDPLQSVDILLFVAER